MQLWEESDVLLLCLPRTCIRGQGFVGCSWGILRFFDIQAISHQEALEVLSFLEARLQPCVCLVPLVPLILLYTVLYLTCLVSSLHLHIRRLFYDLSLYPVSLYSIVVAQPFRSKSRSRVRQSITTLKSPLAVSLCSTLLRFNFEDGRHPICLFVRNDTSGFALVMAKLSPSLRKWIADTKHIWKLWGHYGHGEFELSLINSRRE